LRCAKKITCHLEPCPRAPLGWRSQRGSLQGTDEPGALEHPFTNKVCDVTSQVQEECDLRRQFVLVEVSQKGQEEHCHQVILLAWRDRSHCLDDLQVPQCQSEVGSFSQGLSGTLTGHRQLRCDGSRGSGTGNCLLLLSVHLLTPGQCVQWTFKVQDRTQSLQDSTAR